MSNASDVASLVNTNLQNALADMINKTVGGVERGVEFLSGQLPDVIHQLLVFKMCWAIVSTLLIVVCLVVIWKITGALFDKSEENKWRDFWPCFPCCVTSIIAIIATPVGLTVVCSKIKTILMIWLAPKLYLLEYAAELLKTQQ